MGDVEGAIAVLRFEEVRSLCRDVEGVRSLFGDVGSALAKLTEGIAIWGFGSAIAL
ncbi:hypothetical protein [Sphaerospermopsis reniformis]|uniref:hypothetical protein n=1 Tax=Sphaerospermopsis reniformis TaxID=531300 RepID=UPI0013968059|nr:hypothetical protein [Sphaerospermopsis reniformis]